MKTELEIIEELYEKYDEKEYCKELIVEAMNIWYSQKVTEAIEKHDKFQLIYGKQNKTKVEAELKPCPFCNGKAELSGMFPSGQYYVECADCRANLWDDRKDKAIGHWNFRNGNNTLTS